VYGLKWFLNFTQLYGIPWRHAEVGDTKDENAVKTALAAIGSNGYIVTKAGTKINILAPSSTSGASLPQRELIALADQQCDQFILGQTLTSGVSEDGGSRALGEVHQGTLDGVVDGVADFVGGILTHQLIPAIVAVNYGDAMTELPEMWAKREEVKDEKALAERDEKIGITTGKVPVGKAWFYERHGIPMPADADELLMEEPDPDHPVGPDGKPLSPPSPDGSAGDPPPGGFATVPPHETKGGKGKPPTVTKAEAALAIVQAGGFRTLEDGRVIYIENTRADAPGDASAGRYRQLGSTQRESADKAIDRESSAKGDSPPSAEELRKPGEKPDDEKPAEKSSETIDLEKARKEYEAEQLDESMSGFPEIGKEMKGKLPRPEDLPAGDPLRGEVQNIWDRFKKETRNEDGDGRAVIAPSGAAQYFAPKGTKVNLDDLRQSLNEQGFDFQTPGDMLGAVYESLEGRKSWGTMSRGDTFDVAASDATIQNDPAEVAALITKMKAAAESGIADEDAIGALFAAAWIQGAKQEGE
jgi:hypothetical protein